MLGRQAQILVVDDEITMVRSLELLLRSLGQVYKAYSVPEAEKFFSDYQKIDCVITDVSMPEASGIELLEKLRKRCPEIPVVVMTAYSSIAQAVEAMQKGAFEYIVKPFENNDFLQVIRKALEKKGVIDGETASIPSGWVCNSKAMKEFLVRAEKVAKNSSPLLILGEVGVGKSRAARWIHEKGLKSKGEFFVVDGRMHEEDSPLLQKNLNRAGTIFVAEIFSLTRRLQDKLMSIMLEEKVQVIGSSSSSPEFQSIPDFRKELFDCLTALTIKVPGLRERGDDFEGLIQEVLRDLARKMRTNPFHIEESTIVKLKERVYPGNVRELEKILERAVLEARAGVITDDMLFFENKDLQNFLPFSIPVEEGWTRLSLLKDSLERELIVRSLEKYPKASNTQIASILGTTRRILELRMNAYHIREG